MKNTKQWLQDIDKAASKPKHTQIIVESTVYVGSMRIKDALTYIVWGEFFTAVINTAGKQILCIAISSQNPKIQVATLVYAHHQFLTWKE